MEETTTATEAIIEPAMNQEETKSATLPPAGDPTQTFTKEDVAKAVEDAKKQWQSEQDQSARLAKMSKDDREKEQLKIDKENLDKERAVFARQQLETETKNQLMERKLPTVFATRICGDDADSTKANIESLEKEWNSAIETAVTDRLKGKPPKLGEGTQQQTGNFFDIIKENQRM